MRLPCWNCGGDGVVVGCKWCSDNDTSAATQTAPDSDHSGRQFQERER